MALDFGITLWTAVQMNGSLLHAMQLPTVVVQQQALQVGTGLLTPTPAS